MDQTTCSKPRRMYATRAGTFDSGAVIVPGRGDLLMLSVYLAATTVGDRWAHVTGGACTSPQILLSKKLIAGNSVDFVLPACGMPACDTQVSISTSGDALAGDAEQLLRIAATAAMEPRER